MEISAEQIAQFHQDGAICIRKAFTQDWLAKIATGMQTILENPSSRCEQMKDAGGSSQFFIDYYNWQQIEEFADFIHNSPAAGLVGQLMQSEYSVFYHEMVLIKEPGVNKTTPWHQDMSYYPIEGSKACSIWLPLDPVSEDTTLEFLAHSHKSSLPYRPKEFDEHVDYKLVNEVELNEFASVPDIDNNRNDFQIIKWAVEPGDAVIFSMKTLHSAPGNQHLTNRRVFSTRWLGDDCFAAPQKPWKNPMPEIEGINIGDKITGSKDLPLIWSQEKILK